MGDVLIILISVPLLITGIVLIVLNIRGLSKLRRLKHDWAYEEKRSKEASRQKRRWCIDWYWITLLVVYGLGYIICLSPADRYMMEHHAMKDLDFHYRLNDCVYPAMVISSFWPLVLLYYLAKMFFDRRQETEAPRA
jgi:hypothetical protein